MDQDTLNSLSLLDAHGNTDRYGLGVERVISRRKRIDYLGAVISKYQASRAVHGGIRRHGDKIDEIRVDARAWEKKGADLQAEVDSLFDRLKLHGDGRDKAMARHENLDKARLELRNRLLNEDLIQARKESVNFIKDSTKVITTSHFDNVISGMKSDMKNNGSNKALITDIGKVAADLKTEVIESFQTSSDKRIENILEVLKIMQEGINAIKTESTAAVTGAITGLSTTDSVTQTGDKVVLAVSGIKDALCSAITDTGSSTVDKINTTVMGLATTATITQAKEDILSSVSGTKELIEGVTKLVSEIPLPAISKDVDGLRDKLSGEIGAVGTSVSDVGTAVVGLAESIPTKDDLAQGISSMQDLLKGFITDAISGMKTTIDEKEESAGLRLEVSKLTSTTKAFDMERSREQKEFKTRSNEAMETISALEGDLKAITLKCENAVSELSREKNSRAEAETSLRAEFDEKVKQLDEKYSAVARELEHKYNSEKALVEERFVNNINDVHLKVSTGLQAGYTTALDKAQIDIQSRYDSHLAAARDYLEKALTTAREELGNKHSDDLNRVKKAYEGKVEDLKQKHEIALTAVREELKNKYSMDLNTVKEVQEIALVAAHAELDQGKKEYEGILAAIRTGYATELESVTKELEEKHARDLSEARSMADGFSWDLSMAITDRDKASSDLVAVKGCLDTVLADNTDLDTRLEKAVNERDMGTARITTLESEVLRITAERDCSTAQVATLEQTNKKLQGKGEDISKRLDESEAQVSLLQTERNSAVSRATALERNNEESKSKIDQAERLVKELRQNNDESSARVATLDGNVLTQHQEIVDLREKLRTANQAMIGLQEQVDKASSTLEEHNNQAVALKGKYENKLAEASQRVAELERAADGYKGDRDKVSGQLGEAKRQAAEFKDQVEAHSVTIRSLRENDATRDGELRLANDTIASRTAERDSLNEHIKEFDGLANELAIAKSTKGQMEARLARLDESREDLQREVDSIRESNAHSKTDYDRQAVQLRDAIAERDQRGRTITSLRLRVEQLEGGVQTPHYETTPRDDTTTNLRRQLQEARAEVEKSHREYERVRGDSDRFQRELGAERERFSSLQAEQETLRSDLSRAKRFIDGLGDNAADARVNDLRDQLDTAHRRIRVLDRAIPNRVSWAKGSTHGSSDGEEPFPPAGRSVSLPTIVIFDSLITPTRHSLDNSTAESHGADKRLRVDGTSSRPSVDSSRRGLNPEAEVWNSAPKDVSAADATRRNPRWVSSGHHQPRDMRDVVPPPQPPALSYDAPARRIIKPVSYAERFGGTGSPRDSASSAPDPNFQGRIPIRQQHIPQIYDPVREVTTQQPLPAQPMVYVPDIPDRISSRLQVPERAVALERPSQPAGQYQTQYGFLSPQLPSRRPLFQGSAQNIPLRRSSIAAVMPLDEHVGVAGVAQGVVARQEHDIFESSYVSYQSSVGEVLDSTNTSMSELVPVLRQAHVVGEAHHRSVSLGDGGGRLKFSRDMVMPVSFIATGRVLDGFIVQSGVHAQTVDYVAAVIQDWVYRSKVGSWDRHSSKRNACVNVKWGPTRAADDTEGPNPQYACATCVHARMPCIRSMDYGPSRVLPLPYADREFAATPQTEGFYIRK